MPKFCTNCGTRLDDFYRFCTFCGQRVIDWPAVGGDIIPTDIQNSPTPSKRDISTDELPSIDDFDMTTALGQLQYALAYFSPYRNTYIESQRLSQLIQTEEPPPTGGRILFWGISGGVISFFIMALFSQSSGILTILALVATVIFALLVVLGLILCINGNQQVRRYEENIRILCRQIEDYDVQLREHYNRFANCPVAFEYSSPIVLESLVQYVKTGRADTVKEAINCLIMDAHNQEMLRIQQEVAQNSKKAAESAQSAAVFTAASYLKTNQRR